jgi:predicted transcriptional regulator
VTRRERITLLGALLENLALAQDEPGGLKLTRVAMRTNLAYDRFHDLFTELQNMGLVTREVPYNLTPAGRELLAKYRTLHRALRELGLVATALDPSTTHEP